MSLVDKKDTKIKIHACRICLDPSCVDMVLIEEQNGWLKLYEYCFGITLTTQDEPRLLCQICAEKVQSFVKLKERCEKSHSLWNSLSGVDVQCCVIKHQPKVSESTKINASNEIKEEIFDPFLDSETNFSGSYEVEIDDLPPTEKKETPEDDTKSGNEESSENKIEDSVVGVSDISNQNECKILIDSNGSVKRNKDKVYTCKKCKLTYGIKGWYLKHIKDCRKEKNVPEGRFYRQDYAYDLGRQYYNGQNISEVKHESNSVITCQTQYVSLDSCGICNLKFATEKDLCIHLNDHWSNNDLACKLCDFVGVDLAATTAHRYSHFLRKSISHFLCHICEKNHASLFALHFHYRREHLKKPGGYCSRCNKEYTKSGPWRKHELTHCPPNFVCDTCGKGYFYKNSIIEHMLYHMKIKNSICDICGKTFTRLRSLKLHKDTVHANSGPLKCTHCNRMFKNAVTLRVHRNAVNREKTLKCEVCQKCFITPNVLKLHMVMHSDERPHSCDICGISYKYKNQLTSHLIKHNGMKPQCSICMKTFSNNKSLKRHSSVHTGVRQHSCVVPNCVKTFYSKKLMLAHLESRHKNENGGENTVIAIENSVKNNELGNIAI